MIPIHVTYRVACTGDTHGHTATDRTAWVQGTYLQVTQEGVRRGLHHLYLQDLTKGWWQPQGAVQLVESWPRIQVLSSLSSME